MKIELVKDELVVDLFPERVFTEKEYEKLEEFLDDIIEVTEAKELLGEQTTNSVAKMHHKIEMLEKEIELDLIDIAKGYLGVEGWQFAKGVLKDMVEAKNEENMQELHSVVRIKRM